MLDRGTPTSRMVEEPYAKVCIISLDLFSLPFTQGGGGVFLPHPVALFAALTSHS